MQEDSFKNENKLTGTGLAPLQHSTLIFTT